MAKVDKKSLLNSSAFGNNAPAEQSSPATPKAIKVEKEKKKGLLQSIFKKDKEVQNQKATPSKENKKALLKEAVESSFNQDSSREPVKFNQPPERVISSTAVHTQAVVFCNPGLLTSVKDIFGDSAEAVFTNSHKQIERLLKGHSHYRFLALILTKEYFGKEEEKLLVLKSVSLAKSFGMQIVCLTDVIELSTVADKTFDITDNKVCKSTVEELIDYMGCQVNPLFLDNDLDRELDEPGTGDDAFKYTGALGETIQAKEKLLLDANIVGSIKANPPTKEEIASTGNITDLGTFLSNFKSGREINDFHNFVRGIEREIPPSDREGRLLALTGYLKVSEAQKSMLVSIMDLLLEEAEEKSKAMDENLVNVTSMSEDAGALLQMRESLVQSVTDELGKYKKTVQNVQNLQMLFSEFVVESQNNILPLLENSSLASSYQGVYSGLKAYEKELNEKKNSLIGVYNATVNSANVLINNMKSVIDIDSFIISDLTVKVRNLADRLETSEGVSYEKGVSIVNIGRSNILLPSMSYLALNGKKDVFILDVTGSMTAVEEGNKSPYQTDINMFLNWNRGDSKLPFSRLEVSPYDFRDKYIHILMNLQDMSELYKKVYLLIPMSDEVNYMQFLKDVEGKRYTIRYVLDEQELTSIETLRALSGGFPQGYNKQLAVVRREGSVVSKQEVLALISKSSKSLSLSLILDSLTKNVSDSEAYLTDWLMKLEGVL